MKIAQSKKAAVASGQGNNHPLFKVKTEKGIFYTRVAVETTEVAEQRIKEIFNIANVSIFNLELLKGASTSGFGDRAVFIPAEGTTIYAGRRLFIALGKEWSFPDGSKR